MAKDRLNPCKHYVCNGECEKGREADFYGYCKICNKYEPRARIKHLNQKKLKLNNIKNKEMEM